MVKGEQFCSKSYGKLCIGKPRIALGSSGLENVTADKSKRRTIKDVDYIEAPECEFITHLSESETAPYRSLEYRPAAS